MTGAAAGKTSSKHGQNFVIGLRGRVRLGGGRRFGDERLGRAGQLLADDDNRDWLAGAVAVIQAAIACHAGTLADQLADLEAVFQTHGGNRRRRQAAADGRRPNRRRGRPPSSNSRNRRTTSRRPGAGRSRRDRRSDPERAALRSAAKGSPPRKTRRLLPVPRACPPVPAVRLPRAGRQARRRPPRRRGRVGRRAPLWRPRPRRAGGGVTSQVGSTSSDETIRRWVSSSGPGLSSEPANRPHARRWNQRSWKTYPSSS